jgi:hypothetical protein
LIESRYRDSARQSEKKRSIGVILYSLFNERSEIFCRYGRFRLFFDRREGKSSMLDWF